MARADEVIELENLLQCECRLLADCVAKVQNYRVTIFWL
jgi:hypothetical protein